MIMFNFNDICGSNFRFIQIRRLDFGIEVELLFIFNFHFRFNIV